MTAPDTSRPLVDHARTELEILGEFVHSPAYAQSLVCAVAAFASFGHSGGSAMEATAVLGRLLEFENLTPLTSDPAEWVDRTAVSNLPAGQTLWQSVRNSKAFTDDQAATFWLVDDDALTRATRYPTIAPGTYPADERLDSYELPPPVDAFGPCDRTRGGVS